MGAVSEQMYLSVGSLIEMERWLAHHICFQGSAIPQSKSCPPDMEMSPTGKLQMMHTEAASFLSYLGLLEAKPFIHS